VKVQPHESLGRYCVEGEIGRGAMGVVYRARDPKIDRIVAVKTISLAGQDPAEELEYRERFSQEARAAGQLSHPGIVTIFDAAEDPQTREPFLVMEYVRGEPLSRVLREAGGKLPAENALFFALEIAEALAYAHSRGVVHGDIKPANILITDDGHAKIADFGVARFNQGLITNTGKIFGSPAYMAPEQLTGGTPDARSDLFSLGVMLYSMLTGFRPFQGNTAETVCFKVMNIEPVPVSSFQAELPPGLDNIVSRAIAKEPRERYQSGIEMADEIRAFMQRSSGEDTGSMGARARVASESAHESLGTRISKAFLWQSALIVLLTAASLAGWQIKTEFQEAEKIPAPPARIAVAPAIQRTPKALLRALHPKKAAPSPTAATDAPVVIPTAKLHVEILHHFAAGKAAILVDNRPALELDLHSDDQRHPVFRAIEMNHVAEIDLALGKHTLEIHVVAPGSDYDQVEKVDTEIESGKKHTLIVNCDKRTLQVTLR
jgi:eukaryotic-like serine/threonine-protein kinase